MSDGSREFLRDVSGAATPRELLQSLNRELSGWSILLDPGGVVEMVEPSEAVNYLPVVRMEHERLSRLRHGSSAWSDDRGRAVIHAVATAGRTHGYLAVGAGVDVPPSDMETAVDAVRNLLVFQVDKAHAVRRAERSFRSAIVQLLLAGLHREATLAARPADIVLPHPPVRVAAVSHLRGRPATPADRVLGFVERDLALAVANAICGENEQGHLAIVLSSVEGDVTALRALATDVDGVRMGLSEPADYADLPRAAGEADRLARSITPESPLITTRESTYGSGLLAHIDGPGARAYVDSLLAPIVRAGEQGSLDLLGTLRVFLESDGRWSEAADKLGIHRHTLRYRIRKVEDLLGRSLNDTGMRSELWFAFKLTDTTPRDEP